MRIHAPIIAALVLTGLDFVFAFWLARFRKAGRFFENTFDYLRRDNYVAPGDRLAPLLVFTSLAAVLAWVYALA